MKKIFSTLILVLILSVACKNSINKISGNGIITESEVMIEPFSTLIIETICNVEIIQSDSQKVVIEGDENFHEYIDIKNIGEKLLVKTNSNTQFKDFEKLVIKVHCNQLSKLEISSLGSVSSISEIKCDNINVKISSAGSTYLRLNSKSIDIKTATTGNVTIRGKSDQSVVNNSSVANIDMGQFSTKSLRINNSGSGNITVNASDEIFINHSGDGKLNYAGNPVVKELKSVAINKIEVEE